jgi:hypothetical protein
LKAQAHEAIPGGSRNVAQAISQLRRGIDALLQSRWSELPRRRAETLAEALVKACRRARARRAMRAAQALQALVRLDSQDLYLIHGPLREKLRELLTLVRTYAACG